MLARRSSPELKPEWNAGAGTKTEVALMAVGHGKFPGMLANNADPEGTPRFIEDKLGLLKLGGKR